MAFQLSQDEKYLKYKQLKKYTDGVKNYIDNKDTKINNSLSQAINDEKLARELADQNLESYVKKEVKSQLDTEIANRETSETEIKNSITTLEVNLNNNLNNEISNRQNALNSLKEEINSSISTLENSLTESINNEITAREQLGTTLEGSINSKTSLDNKSIIRKNGDIQLNSSYINYIENALYEENKPSIVSFNFTGGLKTSYELGTKVYPEGFEHKEENIDRIDGTLSLKKNGTIVKSGIVKSKILTTINYEDTVTSDTKYELVLTASKPDNTLETISKILQISFYAPAFIILSRQDTITADQIIENDPYNIISKDKKTSDTLTGVQSISLSENGYIYFVTVKNINKITDSDTGFNFDFSKLESISIRFVTGGDLKTYNIYRSAKLIPNTYNVIIS